MPGLTENWRDVPGYEGRYLVSDQGRVRSLLTGRVLQQMLNSRGYLQVSLHSKGQRIFNTHRLVLHAFVGPKPRFGVSRHLDGIRTNNALSNLAWGTQKENIADKFRHNGNQCGENNPSAKLTQEQVALIRGHPKRRGAQTELAKRFGVSRRQIRHIVSGQQWRPTLQ